jgi:hypothetical protein
VNDRLERIAERRRKKAQRLEENRVINLMLDAGKSPGEIAEQLGYTLKHIHRRGRGLGIPPCPPNRRRFSIHVRPASVDCIRGLAAKALVTPKELAENLFHVLTEDGGKTATKSAE